MSYYTHVARFLVSNSISESNSRSTLQGFELGSSRALISTAIMTLSEGSELKYMRLRVDVKIRELTSGSMKLCIIIDRRSINLQAYAPGIINPVLCKRFASPIEQGRGSLVPFAVKQHVSQHAR